MSRDATRPLALVQFANAASAGLAGSIIGAQRRQRVAATSNRPTDETGAEIGRVR